MDKSDSSEEYYDSSDEDIYADEGGGLVESGAVPAHLLETMPHRAIGMITFEHHTKTQLPPSNGTGFLIAPNLVVTVAHVIFDAKENKFYKSIKFTLGSRRANKKTVKVLECKVPEEYMQLHPNKLRSKFSVKYDYSLLKL
jgi:V8-like Glu-specific endopeptidase